MNNDHAQNIKSKIDLIEHIKTHHPDLEKKVYGDTIRFNPCPICGKKECFSISKTDPKKYTCFTQNKHGSIIDFLIHTGKAETVSEAIKILSKEYNIETNNNTTPTPKNNYQVKLLKYSPPLAKETAEIWLKTRKLGRYTKKALKLLLNQEYIRENTYNNVLSIVVPTFTLKQLKQKEIAPHKIRQALLINAKGENYIDSRTKEDMKTNKILKGKSKGCYYLPANSDKIIMVESFANALCLNLVGLSAICLFGTKNLNLIPEIKTMFPEKEILLWLDRMVEDKQINACRNYDIKGIWFEEYRQNSYDVNDLLSENTEKFEYLVKEKIRTTAPEPNWWKGCRQQKEKEEKERKAKLRKKINVIPGNLHEMIDEIEKVLIEKKPNLFQRCGILVHCTKYNGEYGLKEVKKDHLIELFTRLAWWQKHNEKIDAYKPVDCPPGVAGSYIARPHWGIRELTGIINAPIMREDGTLLENPGYDERTGLLYQPTCKYEKVNPIPTKDEAHEALKSLQNLLKNDQDIGFPFVDTLDQTVSIAAILTSIIRPILKTAPAFVSTAPRMSSGKTLLADIPAIIATGQECYKAPLPITREEEHKFLFTHFITGRPNVCFDNISRVVNSDLLCLVLTAATWGARLLGKNEEKKVKTTTTMFLNGNNIIIKGDLSTRTLLCRLDPRCEHPEERKFTYDIRKHTLKNRGKYIRDALTIMLAYRLSKESVNLPQYGRFESWGRLVRDSLAWLGLPDPCISKKTIEAEDPERENLVNLLYAWYDCFGTEPRTIQEVKSFAIDIYTDDPQRAKKEVLHDAIIQIAENRGNIDDRRFGCYLRKHINRKETGIKIERLDKTRRGTKWKVAINFDRNLLLRAKNMIKNGCYENDIMRQLRIPDCIQSKFFDDMCTLENSTSKATYNNDAENHSPVE